MPICSECGYPTAPWPLTQHLPKWPDLAGKVDYLCEKCDLQMVEDGFRWPQHLRIKVRPLSEIRAEWEEKYGDAYSI